MAAPATTRRADGAPEPDPASAPVAAVETWAEPLRRACSTLAGPEMAYEQAPEALDHGHGTAAFGFRLRPASRSSQMAEGSGRDGTAPGGSGWSEPLSARLAPDRAELEREAAALGVNARHGLGAPRVVSIVALDPIDGQAWWALVTEPRAEVPLPELIGFNLHQASEILTGFARHHAAIHDLVVDDEARAALPTVVAADELARIDPAFMRAEHEWLAARVPPPADHLVLGHGGYQPMCVSGPPPDAWADHGGPGNGLVVDNWSGAALVEAEFDVAFTLVAFWSAHCFAPNRSERTAIKMIRNTLLNTYKLGYQSCREFDPERVRFWQAFHALRGLARMSGAYDAAGSSFAAQDRGPLPDLLAPELQRHFKQLTRVR